MKKKPRIRAALAIAILTGLILARNATADSLDEIDRDITELSNSIQKIEKELDILSKTIATPKGGTLVVKLGSSGKLDVPLTLELLLNGEEEAVLNFQPGGVKKNPGEMHRVYLIPGKYELTVRGRAGGKKLEEAGPVELNVQRDKVTEVFLTPVGKGKNRKIKIIVKSR